MPSKPKRKAREWRGYALDTAMDMGPTMKVRTWADMQRLDIAPRFIIKVIVREVIRPARKKGGGR